MRFLLVRLRRRRVQSRRRKMMISRTRSGFSLFLNGGMAVRNATPRSVMVR